MIARAGLKLWQPHDRSYKAVPEPKSASRFFPPEAAFLRILAILGGGPSPGEGLA